MNDDVPDKSRFTSRKRERRMGKDRRSRFRLVLLSDASTMNKTLSPSRSKQVVMN